jgi:hypothetical protein
LTIKQGTKIREGYRTQVDERGAKLYDNIKVVIGYIRLWILKVQINLLKEYIGSEVVCAALSTL